MAGVVVAVAAWLSLASLSQSEVTWLLVASLIVGKSCVVFFFGSTDFRAGGRLPLIHRTGDLVSIEGLAMDHSIQPVPEADNGSLSVFCPPRFRGESFEHRYVRVDVPPEHLQLHQLIVGILLLRGVGPCCLKRCVKLVP